MASHGYTDEKNVETIIAALKAHGIKKIVASPGTMNITFIGSVQYDPYFEIYSAADERSAAYIACGISAASNNEPVVLTCTGATATRNYIPGLTEAYYRKLPIAVIVPIVGLGKINQNIPQIIDRSVEQKDTFVKNTYLPYVHDDDGQLECGMMVNDSLAELRHNGGGPVLISYETKVSSDFSKKTLPAISKLERYYYGDSMPDVPPNKKVGVLVGNHARWTKRLTGMVDDFCEKYNAVVLCDATSNFHGKYRIDASLVATQKGDESPCQQMDILIDIGNISGAYLTLRPKESWRVCEDGAAKNRSYNLTKVFQMSETKFFEFYVKKNLGGANSSLSYYNDWLSTDKTLRSKISDSNIPFSNVWMARQIVNMVPTGANVYLGILNTLRSWNLTETKSVDCMFYSNTGGFGIDGTLSSGLGVSLAEQDKLCFVLCGDLAFFYDMNALGNRHVGKNLRIMVVNNGKGTEFRNYFHPASRFGDDANCFMAAAGHYGNSSSELVKDYAENLGFRYISASNKEEFLSQAAIFMDNNIADSPMVFEVFTKSKDESDALEYILQLNDSFKTKIKGKAKNLLGDRVKTKLKKVLK